jgi:CheY-like chemotaxis protein
LLTSSNWGPVSLHGLVQAEIEAFSFGEDAVAMHGPDIMLDHRAFSAMILVIHELVTNARKYGALKQPGGHITLHTSVDETGNVAMTWQEGGGPPVAAPLHRGFGSTILDQVIPFELNGTCSAQYPVSGFVLELSLPAAVAQIAPSGHSMSSQSSGKGRSHDGRMTLLLTDVLLVEDNLFIALDAEDLLRGLGARTVTVARSVSEALAAIADKRFSFALLDVNLGPETSMPIARALDAVGTRVAFGTGYGEALILPEALEDIPIVSKPYHRAGMVKVLQPLAEVAAMRPADAASCGSTH